MCSPLTPVDGLAGQQVSGKYVSPRERVQCPACRLHGGHGSQGAWVASLHSPLHRRLQEEKWGDLTGAGQPEHKLMDGLPAVTEGSSMRGDGHPLQVPLGVGDALGSALLQLQGKKA